MLDFPLPASVLFGTFHLLVQHHRADVTACSDERPYCPVRSLSVTKAMFTLEDGKDHKEVQCNEGSPGRTMRQGTPGAITKVSVRQCYDGAGSLSGTE